MEYSNFSWFDKILDTKEKIKVYESLGLTNSDIEMGEGKDILDEVINSNQIEDIYKKVDIHWCSNILYLNT